MQLAHNEQCTVGEVDVTHSRNVNLIREVRGGEWPGRVEKNSNRFFSVSVETETMSTMDAFDIEEIDEYLHAIGMSTSNRASCIRVIKKLITGKGVTHRNKPGEAFLLGHKVTPNDDIEAIRMAAGIWLPHRKGIGCLDKGHGWALNHPLKKLAMYKKHTLTKVALVTDHAEARATYTQ
jgi:hypothetical protein